MNFDVYGPYEIKRFTPSKLLTKDTLLAIRAQCPDLILTCGCYVFATRAGKGFTPWYVGQANKTSLIAEAFNASNINKLNEAFAHIKGTPVVFFLPLLTKNGNFAKPSSAGKGRKSVDFLEEWLIASALQKNSKLINQQKTKFLRELHVRGLFNARQGEADVHSNKLKKALNLS
jgi:hypothetical protein